VVRLVLCDLAINAITRAHKEPAMQTETTVTEPCCAERSRYQKAIEASKRIRWDIDPDVLRGRQGGFSTTSCPTASSLVGELHRPGRLAS
jgi:hypothetical protein